MLEETNFGVGYDHDSLTSVKEIKEFMDSDLFASFVTLNLADKS